jgi:SAM-dependent methyltransferase
MDMTKALFLREPLGEENGIPIFSQLDDYILNYEMISKDHTDHLDALGTNPFLDSAEYVEKLEQQTRDFIVAHAGTSATSVLDVGVGLGSLISRLGVPEKFGLDVSMQYLPRAQAKGIKVVMSKVEDMPFASGRFDLVTCTDVLEHALDYLRCVFQIGRVIRPGGTLIVRVPYKENLDAYREARQYDLVHLRNFDLSSLRLHFESLLGFEYLGHDFLGHVYRGWKNSVFEDLILNRAAAEKWSQNARAAGEKQAAEMVNEGHFQLEDIMNRLSIDSPELFEEAKVALNRPVEICVAFRRPEQGAAFTESPLGKIYRHLMETGVDSSGSATARPLIRGEERQAESLVRQLKDVARGQMEVAESMREILKQQSEIAGQLQSLRFLSKIGSVLKRFLPSRQAMN